MSSHRPRKRFGQHFLHERGVIQRIVTAFSPKPTDHVVEIGPGEGVLTRELAGKVARLDVVEIDRDLIGHLRQSLPETVIIHNADALAFDFCTLAPSHSKLRVIGNLPYNISTPLLFHLLDQAHCVGDMLFMLQKEVVDRMVATPGGKEYGRLSVMLQWGAEMEKLFNVGAGAFRPPPKVDSSVVRLMLHAVPPVEVHDPQRFAQIVKAAFSQRRKVLRNTLKGLVAPEIMERLGIDPGRRAETLSLMEFSALANTAV
ncbi:MAG: 16S rRNA (adenine(1518)-N(6)/adenine(1519)-N(6))-dimethyltransferase RsmA [Gammaproteobacteria bacterium]|nr:16S rRNA (adenine(1518)-N(6)/adenine(1519)-N(6))-dimethyltransferase RsmA [Gammaproteobacteria bacterium]